MVVPSRQFKWLKKLTVNESASVIDEILNSADDCNSLDADGGSTGDVFSAHTSETSPGYLFSHVYC